MNAIYKEAQRDADRLSHRTESMIDDRSQSVSGALITEGRAVLEAIESDRPPRSIEDTIKRVQQRLEDLKSTPSPAISPNDAGTLLDEYEQLRRQIRELPGY